MTDQSNGGITATPIFELYVEELRGEMEALDELLVVKLRWFGEDVAKTAERLASNPDLAVALTQKLSTVMQELDASAGETSQARKSVQTARRWALVVPGTRVVDE